MSETEEFVDQFVPHQQALYRFILSLVGNHGDAEDILQHTMVTVWSKWGSRDADSQPLPWAFGIAKNHVRNHRRKVSRRGEIFGLDDEAISIVSERHSPVSDQDPRRESLERCMAVLADEQRELVDQYYRREQSPEALAAAFNKSVDAFYKSLQRIRKQLFDCISRRLTAEDKS